MPSSPSTAGYDSVISDTMPADDPMPHYEPDEGPLTEVQIAQIRMCVPQGQQVSIRTSLLQESS